MRDAISSVTIWIGENTTSRAQNKIASTTPISSDLAARHSHEKSPTASAKPTPMIGSISGAISIAPITTAGEDSSMPRIAIPADMHTIRM